MGRGKGGASERIHVGYMQLKSAVPMKNCVLVISTCQNVGTFFLWRCFRWIAQNHLFNWWFTMLQLSLGNSSHFVPGESLILFCSYWSNSLEVWQEEPAQGSEGTAKASSQAGLWYQGTCEFLLLGLFLLNSHCSSITVSTQPCQRVAFHNAPALRKHFHTVPNLATLR